jgi:hypothetical protein
MRYELQLRVDVPAPGGQSLGDALGPRSQEMRTAIYGALRLRVHSHSWVRIDLGTAHGRQMVERLAAECAAAGAVMGTATVTERLDDVESAAADWSLLHTKTAYDSFSLWDDYPSYRSGTHPKGHALNHTFVSSEFVDAYRALGLTGLSFLRCKNAGRKQGPPWFAALPDHFLGHGLDHPWFDRDLWVREVGPHSSKRTSSIDTAQYAFHRRWLRADRVARDAVVGPLLALVPEPPPEESTLLGLTIVTVPRYWTAASPAADFAYIPWGEDGPNREGKILRFRQLAVSRRARAALIASSLFPAEVFLAVHSITAPEPGVAVLDELYPRAPPMYTPDELAELRRLEREQFPQRVPRDSAFS